MRLVGCLCMGVVLCGRVVDRMMKQRAEGEDRRVSSGAVGNEAACSRLASHMHMQRSFTKHQTQSLVMTATTAHITHPTPLFVPGMPPVP